MPESRALSKFLAVLNSYIPLSAPPVGPPQARISTKKHGGFGMAVEKREHRIVVYLTDSERRAVTWAAARVRRRPSDAVRLAALDWADAQLARAEREAAQG